MVFVESHLLYVELLISFVVKSEFSNKEIFLRFHYHKLIFYRLKFSRFLLFKSSVYSESGFFVFCFFFWTKWRIRIFGTFYGTSQSTSEAFRIAKWSSSKLVSSRLKLYSVFSLHLVTAVMFQNHMTIRLVCV